MSRNGHIHLNCELGSIAIITRSKFSVNRGIIVKVIEPMGLMHWQVGLDLPQMIKRADDLLYAAKRAGRNQVLTEALARQLVRGLA